ncbi:DUF4422 domain-containing protein [Aeromonas veronii]
MHDIKIFVNYFLNNKVVSNDVFIPIQVGRALSSEKLDMLGDDTGDNISEKNPIYCEITGQYWAWKNQDATHYGFMHYRRFLDFSENNKVTDNVSGIVEDEIRDDFQYKYGLNSETVNNMMSKYDIILPKPFDVRSVGCKSVRHHYNTAPHHFAKDLMLVQQIIQEKYATYFDAMTEALDGNLLFPTNIFIFNREVFCDYNEWLFGIISEFEVRADFKGYNIQESRVIGYLAERLFTIYVLKLLSDIRNGVKTYKIKYLERVFVKNTSTDKVVSPKIPQTNLDIISIAASSNDAYAPHLGALINSLVKNLNANRYYDLIILDGGISNDNKNKISKLIECESNISISFIDMSKKFEKDNIHSYFSKDTLYRLSLPSILGNRSKVLFFDTDMVISGDISELYDLDVSDVFLAAVQDLVMSAFCKMGVRSYAGSGALPAEVYLREYLGVVDPSKYFQAGTLLLNLELMRECNIEDKLISELRHDRYWLLDQDVLNKVCKGMVRFIDNKWNAICVPEDHLSMLPRVEQEKYKSSLVSPHVIHFAGLTKPWTDVHHPFSSYYWSSLRNTPWYEPVLISCLVKNTPSTMQSNKGKGGSDSSFTRSVLQRVWRIIPEKLKQKMFPVACILDRSTR